MSRTKMQDILINAQKECKTHFKYMKALQELYNKTEFDVFLKEFLLCLKNLFITDYKINNAYLNRVFDFCINFIIANDSTESSDLISGVFEEIIIWTKYDYTNIRYQSCEFTQKFLSKFEGSHDVYEKLIEAMLDRVDDVLPSIRIRALNILHCFQDPENPKESITTAFVEALNDSNTKIRAAAVEYLHIIDKVLLPNLIQRTRDIDENVRFCAFKKIATIPMQTFSIEQRQYLLRNCFKEKSDKIQTCLSDVLLPAWFKCYEANYIKFLKALRLDASQQDIDKTVELVENILNTFFESRPIREFLEAIVLEDKLIPQEQLSFEKALFWRILVTYLRSKNLDDYLEQLIPETVVVCNYVKNFSVTCTLQNGQIWDVLCFQHILHQLITIAVDCDISDEMSRIRLNETLIQILKETAQVPGHTIGIIMNFFEQLIPKTDSRINFMCELVSDIRAPLVSTISETELNECNVKIADLKLRRNILLEKQTESLENENYIEAETIKHELLKIKDQLAEILSQIECKQHVTVTINDPKTVEKCLDLIIAMLQSPNITRMNTQLRTLNNMLLVEMKMFQEPEILSKFLTCCGLLCFLDKSCAEEHIQAFCLPIIFYKFKNHLHPKILVASVTSVVDLILRFGSSILPQKESEDLDLDKSIDFDKLFNRELTFIDIVEVLGAMLNDEETEVREIAGGALVKLLSTNRVQSAMLVSRIILKWFNQQTSSDPYLHQLLGVFLEHFSSLPHAPSQLEEAFIPTLRTICLAPNTSPLFVIPKDNVIKFLVKMNKNPIVHKNIAMTLCEEILNNEGNACNVTFAKCLLQLEIPRYDVDIKDLFSLCEDIRCDTRNKDVLKYIIKFMNYLSENDTSEEENEE